MVTSYLPNGENQTLLNSELYFRKDGEPRFRSMGYPDSFTYTPSIETAEKDSVGPGGAIITTATVTKKTGASVKLVLSETVARNMAIALQGDLSAVTQAAAVAVNIDETDVFPGEIIDLKAYGVSNVVLTDGVETLVEGVDYLVNAEAGVITILSAQAVLVGTYDKPEIVEADGKFAIRVLSKTGGTKGVIKVVGINERGTRYDYSDMRVELRPSGDLAFVSTDGDFQSLEFEGKVVANPATPLEPFGRVTVLN